ncbi:unnamed protein product [Lathyrus sativus]|nr:unnamed protein product [Lathyrus sativus]
MSDKFVALLLLVCVVTVQGKGKLMTREACYDYCSKSMFYPKPIGDSICQYRCQFPMYENNPGVPTGVDLKVRKALPNQTAARSPIPAPKIR